MPPQIAGATYSHFAIRVLDRDRIMSLAARQGVQLGQLIEYSMPHLPSYQKYASPDLFPNSLLCSQSMINLPVHPGLDQKKILKVIETISHI
jgi:dTDP-4-amino-4,6-dideoxygalactose transaminase